MNVQNDTPGQVRLQEKEPQPSTSQGGSGQDVDAELDARVQEAREKARCGILEAKQFRAAVNVPQGINNNPYYDQDIKDDDEFVHITCHI